MVKLGATPQTSQWAGARRLGCAETALSSGRLLKLAFGRESEPNVGVADIWRPNCISARDRNVQWVRIDGGIGFKTIRKASHRWSRPPRRHDSLAGAQRYRANCARLSKPRSTPPTAAPSPPYPRIAALHSTVSLRLHRRQRRAPRDTSLLSGAVVACGSFLRLCKLAISFSGYALARTLISFTYRAGAVRPVRPRLKIRFRCSPIMPGAGRRSLDVQRGSGNYAINNKPYCYERINPCRQAAERTNRRVGTGVALDFAGPNRRDAKPAETEHNRSLEAGPAHHHLT